MRPLLIVIGLLSSGALLGGQQHGPLPLPSAVVPPPTSSAADSGVRLALIQPLDAPVVLEAVGHTDDRLGGTVGVHNLTNRAVSAVALAFTIGNAPDATTSAFRHVETLALTLQAGKTASIDVPGIPLTLLRSLSSAEAAVVELAIVGVRFTSGPAWRAAGRGELAGTTRSRHPAGVRRRPGADATGGSAHRRGRGVPGRWAVTSRLWVVLLLAFGVAAPAAAQTETIEYYGTDAVGSVRIVFDASGTVLGRHDYEPFGREILAAWGASSERFGGQSMDDEVQQAYFHARQFQSRTGRFGSIDSLFDGMADPQRWNRYSYVRNSPLRLVDPAGLNPKTGNDRFGYSCADILKKSPNDYWCNPPSIFVIGLLPPPSSAPGRGGLVGGGRRGHDGTGHGGTGGSGNGSSGTDAGLLIDITVVGTAPTSDEGLQVCGGGGFIYGGMGGHAGPVHGEILGLVEYDSRYGGAHGGLFGGGASHFSGGVESIRTWSDWQSHTTPIGLGGIEIPGATTAFGQPISTQTRDIGGLAQYENGDLSVGLYTGATLGSGRTFGGGADVVISSNGCHE